MITRNQITFYRIVASIIVATPLIIEISFQWQILYALLYFPLISLTLAMVAKSIDYKLMAALLLQGKKQKLNNKILPLQQPAKQLHKCAA